MRDVRVVGAGFVFGWLMSKPWSDPECRLGLAIFLVAVMALVFALGVVGHSREPSPDRDEDDDGD